MKTKKVLVILGLLIPLIGFSQWSQLGSTQTGLLEQGLGFGYDVALSADGMTMVVGAPHTSGTGLRENNSYVEVYRYTNGDWVLLGDKVEGEEHIIPVRIGSHAGRSVDISYDGNIIAIGEPIFYTVYEDQLTPQNGRVRIFEYINGDWQQIGNDIMGVAMDVNGNYDFFDTGHEYFGSDVKLSADGNIIAIADDNFTHNGVNKVKVFENINNEWVPLGSTLFGEVDDEGFGTSIDISSDGTVLAIGVPRGTGDVPGPNNPGHLKIYQYQNDEWVLIGKIDGLESDDGWGRGNWAGTSVALSEDGSVVAFSGSQYRNGDGDFVGNVRVFKNVSGTWEQVGEMLEGAKLSYENTKSMVALSADGSVLAFGTGGAFWPPSQGNVQVYQNINDQWQLVDQVINPESSDEESQFGAVVSLSSDGSFLGLGVFGANVDGVYSVGIAKVYQNCNLTNITVLAEDTETICSGQSTVLSAMIEQDYYIENSVVNWYENIDDTVAVFTGNIYETPEIDETTSFWVEAVSPIGCASERVEVVIDPNSKAEPELAFSYDAICTTDTSVLPVLSQDFRTGGTFYTSSSLVVNASTGAIDASNSQPGTYVVVYEVEEDTDNCIDGGTYEFDVTVEACTIQRGISPNNDGLNDAFDLIGYNVKKLRIYNRHGKEIYSKTNYTNQWEGQDNNGNDLPTGTYFYSIDKNNDEQLTGWVYINREL